MKRDSTAYGAVRPVWDRSDCSVRALAAATECTYEAASAVFSAAGRSIKKGTPVQISRTVHETWLGMKEVPTFCFLAAFLVAYPQGRFILHTRTHAFAVIDGIVHDWNDSRVGPRSKLERAWEVGEQARGKMERMRELFA